VKTKPLYASRTLWLALAIAVLPWVGDLLKMPDAVEASIITVLAGAIAECRRQDSRRSAR